MKPATHARRKVPIESKEAIDKELDYLIEEEIITEQVETTSWVSSVMFQMKPNGEVRVCLDPSNLNKAIIREHHKSMTVEEIAHECIPLFDLYEELLTKAGVKSEML